MAKKDKKSVDKVVEEAKEEGIDVEVTEVMVPEQTEPVRVEKPIEEEEEEEKSSVLTI